MSLGAKLSLYFTVVILVIVIGTAITYVIGQNGGFNIQRLSIFNSLYYTVSTISTNSYGDIIPVSAVAKAFTMLLELTGISIFVGALTILTTDIMDARINRVTGGISDWDAKMLKGHTVLIGLNTVNISVADRLRSGKRKFVLLTNNRDHFEDLRNSGYPVHVVNITSRTSLGRYNLALADRIVIDLLDQQLTMYAFLAARGLAGSNTSIRVIVRDKETEKSFKSVALNGNEQALKPGEGIANQILGS